MKILYLYAGTREHINTDVPYPKTQFYGLHALKDMGVDVSYKEFSDVYPKFLRSILPFNIRHILMYFPARKYDVVFGSALLSMMFLKLLFPGKAKFVLLNISVTRLIASQIKGSFKEKIIRLLLTKLDGIVCLSHTQAEFLKEHTEFPHHKIFVAPLGVDTEFYARGEGTHDKTILSVGRDNGRDYKTVFSVAERLPERKFIVACSRRNVEGLTIPKNVEVMYDAPYEEVVRLSRKAHFLLLLTHGTGHNDGADCSGQTALLETMALGLPAIMTYNKCLCEYVTDGTDAFVVEPYNVDMVLEKIKELDNEDVRNMLSVNAEKSVKTKYSEKEMARQLLSIFHTIA